MGNAAPLLPEKDHTLRGYPPPKRPAKGLANSLRPETLLPPDPRWARPSGRRAPSSREGTYSPPKQHGHTAGEGRRPRRPYDQWAAPPTHTHTPPPPPPPPENTAHHTTLTPRHQPPGVAVPPRCAFAVQSAPGLKAAGSAVIPSRDCGGESIRADEVGRAWDRCLAGGGLPPGPIEHRTGH